MSEAKPQAFDVEAARKLADGPIYDSPAYGLPTIGTLKDSLRQACDEIDYWRATAAKYTQSEWWKLLREKDDEIERLRSALQWYADESHHAIMLFGDPVDNPATVRSCSFVSIDAGQRAREALEK